MAPVDCSVPDCPYVTPEGTPVQVLNYLIRHTNAVHLINQPARQVSEIETDPDYEGNICSITAASPNCSDASLPSTAADLAPIVADMRTEGPVTYVPLPHHVHDKVKGWEQSPAADKPTLPVTFSLDRQAYTSLGLSLPRLCHNSQQTLSKYPVWLAEIDLRGLLRLTSEAC